MLQSAESLLKTLVPAMDTLRLHLRHLQASNPSATELSTKKVALNALLLYCKINVHTALAACKSASIPEPELRGSKRRKPCPDAGVRPDTLKFPSGDIYTGATRDRKPHGYGKMTFEVDEADEEEGVTHTDVPDDSDTCFYWEGEWDTGGKHGNKCICLHIFPRPPTQSSHF